MKSKSVISSVQIVTEIELIKGDNSMQWKSYPTKKDTPSRRTRKSQRNEVFRHNYKLRAKLNRERRAQRLNNA